jgi:hypothetical protein
MAKNSRIIKVAGFSLVGFCAVALAADKASLAPEVAQVAGFCGAFVGAIVGRGRAARDAVGEKATELETELKKE